jgi:DNA (cytosine-5)-methyltransferase 1
MVEKGALFQSSPDEPATPSRTFAEFFAGIGLMRLGLEQEGWSAAFANDICADKHEMYCAHFDDQQPLYLIKDVHLLEPDEVPTVTLATASFPCNDLSLAGMRQGLGGRQSSAYWGFIKILDRLRERRPKLVLLENVAGFLTSHGGRDFQAALLALNRLGYAVDPIMIDASRFVPQSRVRLFVIARFDDRCQAWESHDASRFYESDVRPKALADYIFRHPEIVWSIKSLPDLPVRSLTLTDILEDIPECSPAWWNKDRVDYLVNQMSAKHRQTLEKMTEGEGWSYGTVFRRIRNGRSMAELRNDGIAGCLRTPRGGSGRQILLRAGRGRTSARLLVPAECASLMGAPGFRITASLNQALFGFGDAVCVPAVAWIARNYLNEILSERKPDAVSWPKTDHRLGRTDKLENLVVGDAQWT